VKWYVVASVVFLLFTALPAPAEPSFGDPVLCAGQTSEWWQAPPSGRIGPRNELYVAWTHSGFGSGDGGVYFARSLDTNRTWSPGITVHFWDPSWIHAVYSGPTLVEFNDTLYCLYWTKPEGSEARHLYASRSDDRGASWNIFETSISGSVSDNPGRVSCVVLPGGVVHLVFATRLGMARDRTYYCRSTNGGITFSAPAPLPGDPSATSVYAPSFVVASGGELLVAVTYSGPALLLNRSTDNGATWDTTRLTAQLGAGSYPSLYSAGANSLCLLWEGPSNGELRFAASEDLGRTWSAPFSIVGASWSYGFAARDDRVLALWGDDGAWDNFQRYSSDGGATWAAAEPVWSSNPFPGDWLTFRADIRNDLAAFWMHPEPGDIEATYCAAAEWQTGVNEPGRVVAPIAPALFATPSVFSSLTAFGFPAGFRPGTVLVSDASGRPVRRLDGSTGLRWNGADERGRRLPAGVYVCRTDGLRPARVVLVD
jgi:hypothetical protein